MNVIIVKIFLGTIFHFFLNFIFKKNKFFIDNQSHSNHKKLTADNKKNLLTGGLSILILLCILVTENYQLKLFCILMFLVGLCSDLNFINSPIKRFIIQTILITIFIFQFNNNVVYTDIAIIDFFLEYKIISYFFTIYCFLILINGTNFIDGLNGLVLGYYFLSFLTLLFFIINKNISFDYSIIIIVLIILIINYPFNLIGKNFLGDSGSYLIAFVAGYIFIDFYATYKDVSSLFIVTLLWYPAFENLFSIIRKKISSKKASRPDTNHIHQLIFKYLKINIKNKKLSNIYSGLIVNFYNSIVCLIAYSLFDSSIGLSVLLFINIIIYSSSYILLLKKLKN